MAVVNSFFQPMTDGVEESTQLGKHKTQLQVRVRLSNTLYRIPSQTESRPTSSFAMEIIKTPKVRAENLAFFHSFISAFLYLMRVDGILTELQ